MLRALRRSKPLLGPFALAIAAMVLLGTVNWWHADDEDDVPIAAFHDHAAHHPALRADRTLKNHPDHCYLCHWLRTFHNGLRGTSVRAQVEAASRPVVPHRHARPSDPSLPSFPHALSWRSTRPLSQTVRTNHGPCRSRCGCVRVRVYQRAPCAPWELLP